MANLQGQDKHSAREDTLQRLLGAFTSSGGATVEVDGYSSDALSQLLNTMTLANATGDISLANLLGAITQGTGSIGLTSSTISDIQTAVTAANNDTVVPELTTIGNSLSDIYGKLLSQFEAGQDVGLTEADMTELATLIATLFHYPTDYPNATAHTDSGTLHADNALAYAALGALTTHQTDGTQKTQITSGSNALVVDSLGSAKIGGNFSEVPSLSAGSLNADLVPSTDMSSYKSFAVQITGTYSGTLSFQASNDGSNWVATTAIRDDSGSLASVNTTTLSGGVIYRGNVGARYFRIRMTSYTSGNATGTIEFNTFPVPYVPPTTITAVGSVASGVADTLNPVKTGGVFRTTQPTVTDGQRVDTQSTARGAHIVATGVDGFSTKITDGTNTASVSAGDTRSAMAAGAGVVLTTPISSATVAVDCEQLRYVAVQLIGTTFNVTFQVSDDNSTWSQAYFESRSSSGFIVTPVSNTPEQYVITSTARYFRVLYNSGTVTGSVIQSNVPFEHRSVYAVQSGTWNLSQSTSAQSITTGVWNTGGTFVGTSNNASSSTVVGSTLSMAAAQSFFGMQVIIVGGTLATLTVVLEGSNDGGTTWKTISTFTSTTSDYSVNATPMPFLAIRSRVSVYTVATGTPTVTTKIVGTVG